MSGSFVRVATHEETGPSGRCRWCQGPCNYHTELNGDLPTDAVVVNVEWDNFARDVPTAGWVQRVACRACSAYPLNITRWDLQAWDYWQGPIDTMEERPA